MERAGARAGAVSPSGSLHSTGIAAAAVTGAEEGRPSSIPTTAAVAASGPSSMDRRKGVRGVAEILAVKDTISTG